MSDNERTRTITWENPMAGAQDAMTMKGLEYMQKMVNGDYPAPPIAVLMNMEFAEVEEGRAIFSATPDESFYNPIGTVHGGFLATLCDSALGCAVHTTLPQGTAYTTAELHMNYVRAVSKHTGTLTCEAKVIHSGRKVATAECKVTDKNGKLYAHGTTTCVVFTVSG